MTKQEIMSRIAERVADDILISKRDPMDGELQDAISERIMAFESAAIALGVDSRQMIRLAHMIVSEEIGRQRLRSRKSLS